MAKQKNVNLVEISAHIEGTENERINALVRLESYDNSITDYSRHVKKGADKPKN